MAVRSPLKNDSGNLKEMSSAEVDQVVDQIIYQYSLNPGVSLSVVGSGGNLSSINDTRLEAGVACQVQVHLFLMRQQQTNLSLPLHIKELVKQLQV